MASCSYWPHQFCATSLCVIKRKEEKNKVTVFSLYPPQKRLIAVKHKQDKDKKKNE